MRSKSEFNTEIQESIAMTIQNQDAVAYATIKRFNGYRIGDDGTVWSKWVRSRIGDTWKMLKFRPNGKGYLRVNLKNSESGLIEDCYVHRLVLEAFNGPCPDGMEARHIRNVRSNNSLGNLEYGTHLDNIRDKVVHGTEMFGESNHQSKLDWPKVRFIRRARTRGVPRKFLADYLGVSTSLVGQIDRGSIWKSRNSREKTTRSGSIR